MNLYEMVEHLHKMLHLMDQKLDLILKNQAASPELQAAIDKLDQETAAINKAVSNAKGK